MRGGYFGYYFRFVYNTQSAENRVAEGVLGETPSMLAHTPRRSRWKFPLILLACLAVSLVCVIYPMYVIRPFRHQGPIELAVALAVLQIRPIVTGLASLAAVFCLMVYFRLHRGLIAREHFRDYLQTFFAEAKKSR